MFALAGAVMKGTNRSAQDIWEIADAMLEARKKEKDDEEDVGIARVAKRTYRRKS